MVRIDDDLTPRAIGPHAGPDSAAGSAGGQRNIVSRQRARVPGDAAQRFVDVIETGGSRAQNDAHTLLNSILLDACELLQAARVAMMLYDPARGTIEILDIGKPAFPGRIVKAGEGMAGRVIQSGQPLVVDDWQRWPGKISGEFPGPPVVSAVAVPVRNGSTPIGAMTAHSTDPARRFTADDAHVLEVFADVAMLAVSHFSIHAELRTVNSRLGRRVRERTRALQRSTEEIARKNEQLEALIKEIGRAQNDERRRIAQDIHDGVMQTLSGAIFELKAAETSTDEAALPPRLATVREALHRLEGELRSVIQDLQPVELEDGGLVRAVEEEARRLQAMYGIRCRVRTLGREQTLPQPVEAAALRIAKEALRNVQRHASAILVDVEIHVHRTELRLVVRDYGDGFEPELADDEHPHLGISGMRRRAEAAGGSFRLESTLGRGTEIVATLPIEPTV